MISQTNVLLSGSYARGTQTPNSDMDFIVISENVTFFHTESIYFKGVEVQVIFFPKTKIFRMAMEISNDNYGIIISMLKSCIVISDEDHFANRLSQYANKVSTRPSEHVINSYINILRNRCSDLRHAEDKLEESLLVSTICVLLSHVLSRNFIIGTKHCIRDLRRSSHYQPFLDAINQYTTGGNKIPILEYAETTIRSFCKNVVSTGITLNHLLENSIVTVYFPKKSLDDTGMVKLIDSYVQALSDCQFFVFRQDKWQTLNEGTYMSIKGNKCSATEIIQRLNKVDITLARSRIELGIDVSYPYYTSFDSGVFFGGMIFFEELFPLFSDIWSSYYAFISENKEKEAQRKFSHIAGLTILPQLLEVYERIGGQKDALLKHLAWMILPDVVNTNGVYNIEQSAKLRGAFLELFTEQYIQNEKEYQIIFKDIQNNAIAELSSLFRAVTTFADKLSSLSLDELSYPDIYPFEQKSDIFFIELCLHTLSILQMTSEDKYRVIFNVAKFNRICLEDSL